MELNILNIDNNQIKTEGNIIIKNKEKIKSLNSDKDKKNYSLKSNEYRNNNMTRKKKNLNVKYKKPNLEKK